MSLGFMEYVVDHSHKYPKKSPSTHQINDEPAIIPRTILLDTSHLSDNDGDSAVHLKKSKSKSSRSAIKLVTKSATNSDSKQEVKVPNKLVTRPELPKARSYSTPLTTEPLIQNEVNVVVNRETFSPSTFEDVNTQLLQQSQYQSKTRIPTDKSTSHDQSHNDIESFITKFNQGLEPLHQQASQVFKITTIKQLETLLEFAYDDHRNPLPSSEEVFPYLHGINNIKQRMFFIDKLDYDLPALPSPAAAVLASGDGPVSTTTTTKTTKTTTSTSTTKSGGKHLKKRSIDELYNVEIPQVPHFNLLTVECDSPPFFESGKGGGDRLINSIPLKLLLTPRLADEVHHHGKKEEEEDEDEDAVEYIENIEYEPFDAINRFDAKSVQLKNRNFNDQVKLMTPFAHFLVYDPYLYDVSKDRENIMSQRAANTIEQLTNCDRDQFIYVVDKLVIQQVYDEGSLFLESSHDSIDQPINLVNNQPFSCKLLKLEQNLIWKTHSMKWVYDNVCIGNLIDFTYLTNHHYQSLQKSTNKNHDDQSFKLYINCHENARFPNLSLLKELLRNASGPPELRNKLLQKEILLEFPSSGMVNCEEITWDETLSFLNTLKLIDYYTRVLHQQVFIFCYDGFTGLSLLTLALGNLWDGDFFEDVVVRLMKREQVKLYYFKNDVVFLKKFEKFLYWFKLKHLQVDSVMMTTMVNDLHYEEMDILYKGVIKQRLLELENQVNCKKITRHDGFGGDWFDWDCDNNFPARIYDNLFLGSLTHACSKTILDTCDITTIVSIGEKPSWLYDLNIMFDYETCQINDDQKLIKPLYSFFNGINMAHIYEVKMGFNQDDDCKPPKQIPQLKSIIYIHNVKDDGRDSIMPLLQGCPESIQRKIIVAPKTTKDNNTLIHCKIGVSRSASLVMASVMKYYEMDILQAYMFVRIRRFNIIIQPNLKIFYELFLYDAILRRQRNKSGNQRFGWASLCREIHQLNHFYIH